MKWAADTWSGLQALESGVVNARVSFSEKTGDYVWLVRLHLVGQAGVAMLSGHADDVKTAKKRSSRAAKLLMKNPNKYLMARNNRSPGGGHGCQKTE